MNMIVIWQQRQFYWISRSQVKSQAIFVSGPKFAKLLSSNVKQLRLIMPLSACRLLDLLHDQSSEFAEIKNTVDNLW